MGRPVFGVVGTHCSHRCTVLERGGGLGSRRHRGKSPGPSRHRKLVRSSVGSTCDCCVEPHDRLVDRQEAIVRIPRRDPRACPIPTPFYGFMAVEVAHGMTLDYQTRADPIAAQHYAFLVSEDEFDEIFGRIRAHGIDYWADPDAAPARRDQSRRRRTGRLLPRSRRPSARDPHPPVRQRQLTQHPPAERRRRRMMDESWRVVPHPHRRARAREAGGPRPLRGGASRSSRSSSSAPGCCSCCRRSCRSSSRSHARRPIRASRSPSASSSWLVFVVDLFVHMRYIRQYLRTGHGHLRPRRRGADRAVVPHPRPRGHRDPAARTGRTAAADHRRHAIGEADRAAARPGRDLRGGHAPLLVLGGLHRRARDEPRVRDLRRLAVVGDRDAHHRGLRRHRADHAGGTSRRGVPHGHRRRDARHHLRNARDLLPFRSRPTDGRVGVRRRPTTRS